MRILLVDDSLTDVELTRLAFGRAGLTVELDVVSDGEEALEHLYQCVSSGEKLKPDLVLLDLNLPRMTGHELLSRMKSDPDLRRLPVIVVSTSAIPSDINKSYAAHANAFITKPGSFNAYKETLMAVHAFWSLAKRPS